MIADSNPGDAVVIGGLRAETDSLNQDIVTTGQVGATHVPVSHVPSLAHVRARPPAMIAVTTAVTTAAHVIGRIMVTIMPAAGIAHSREGPGIMGTVIHRDETR